MTRRRPYIIECDGRTALDCHQRIEGGTAQQAERSARREGWRLRSPALGDMCPACLRDDDDARRGGQS